MSSHTVRLNFQFFVAAVVAAIAVAFVFYQVGRSVEDAAAISAYRLPLLEMNDCQAAHGGKAASLDPSSADRVSILCYEHLRRSYILQDFLTRRSLYVQQQVQGTVMLWMVVAITVSGVILAAVQLLAAYRLAVSGIGSLGEANEVRLERGRLSVKSSVTGLSILAISFAFFAVFVAWVYTLKDDSDGPERIPVPQAPSLQSGAQPPLKIIPGVGSLTPSPS